MYRLPQWLGFGLLGLTLLVGAGTSQEAKKEEKKDEKKAKGQLPPGFKDLGLTLEQKGKIYTIQTDYRTKFADLENKIKELKKQEQTDVFKVLTDEQRDKYLKSKGLETKEKKVDKKEAEKK